MIALVDILDEHEPAVTYDLLRCGARLRDFPHDGVTWGDLKALVSQAGPDTAIFRSVNPDWIPPEAEATQLARAQVSFARSLLHSSEMLRWTLAGGESSGPAPSASPLPWDEPDEPEWAIDPLDWDDAAAALGDDPRMHAAMARALAAQDLDP